MKIEVTQKDIDNGVQGECELCPIARAVKRETKRKHVRISREHVEIWRNKSNGSNFYELPKKAQTFVRRFDRQESVKPFSFELENL